MKTKERRFKIISWSVFSGLLLFYLIFPYKPYYTFANYDDSSSALFLPTIILGFTVLIGGVCLMALKGEFYQNTTNDNVYLMKAGDEKKAGNKASKIFLLGTMFYYYYSLVSIAYMVKRLFIENGNDVSKKSVAIQEFYVRTTSLAIISFFVLIVVLLVRYYHLQEEYWRKSFEGVKMNSYQECLEALQNKPVEVTFKQRIQYVLQVFTFDTSIIREENKQARIQEKKDAIEKRAQKARLKEERKKAKEPQAIREDYDWTKKE